MLTRRQLLVGAGAVGLSAFSRARASERVTWDAADVHVDGYLHVCSATQPAGNKGAQFERWHRFACRIRVQ